MWPCPRRLPERNDTATEMCRMTGCPVTSKNRNGCHFFIWSLTCAPVKVTARVQEVMSPAPAHTAAKGQNWIRTHVCPISEPGLLSLHDVHPCWECPRWKRDSRRAPWKGRRQTTEGMTSLGKEQGKPPG
ncbi:hypothetical protein HJG60_008805 [Phyllostomus discolor]|uniref:Uncharacterized protein n=1 Tax=Phyllostomus discolor TaxID=89673 RepID=A0A834DI56_9CHIR|nr:hypothetical protein HJG60_008805 [Phyllostomus discolor]